MNEHKGVWIFIEQRDGEIEGVSLELLGEGKKLAEKLDVPLSGILLGHEVKPLAQKVISYGANQVYVIDNPGIEGLSNRILYERGHLACRKIQARNILIWSNPKW